MSADAWSSDVPVSMPEPTRYDGAVPMFGFVFTHFGLWHDINQSEHDAIARPHFAPIYPFVLPSDG